MVLLTGGFSGTAAAQDEATPEGDVPDSTNSGETEEIGTDFLCGSNANSAFTTTIRNLMTFAMISGPVLGTAAAAFYTVAMSAKPGEDYADNRRSAFISGWSVPIIIYALQIAASVLLGFDFACIVPGGG
jgi:hypothetical protein